MNAGSTTVEFRGDQSLKLVADEWNRGTVDADRPTILMLHGGGQNRFSWKNTGQVLADHGFHVIALDARGHGDSDRAPNAEYTVDAFSRDAAAVLKHIGRPVVLIGASMGGMTGIQTAHQAGPDVVTKLVLVDVVPRFESKGSHRIRDFMTRHVNGFETLEHAADAIAEYLPHRQRPRNLEGLKKNLRHRDGRWHWHWDPAFVTSADQLEQIRTGCCDDPRTRSDSGDQCVQHIVDRHIQEYPRTDAHPIVVDTHGARCVQRVAPQSGVEFG